MKALLTYESDASYEWENDEEPFTLTLTYVPLRTRSSLSSSGDDNDVELLSDLEIHRNVENKGTAAAIVPSAKVCRRKMTSQSEQQFLQPRRQQ